MRRKPGQKGFALVLVLVFAILLLSLWGIAYRETSALLRLETARVQRTFTDQPNLLALGMAVNLLETGTPQNQPTWDNTKNQYVCGVTITTDSGNQSFIVTYSLPGGSGNTWTVTVQPGTTGVPMPSSFSS